MPTIEKVSIPGPAGTLEVVVHVPDIEPRAIAVIAHPLPTMGGTMENKIVTTLAKTFAELGFAALRFNFRGVGASSGEFDEGNGEVEDALTVTRYALKEYGDLPLILSGFSFGGYVQARAAQQLPPRQLVLIAPAVTRYAMPPVPHNTLLVHGELDEVVPLADVMQWARPQLLPIVILPGAVHFFHGRLDQLKEIVRRNFMGQAL
ncbi:MAG: alpha/beta fold hydrolase [Candidatus Nitrotoga sp.]|nr:alpha/beta fold hydrolase [Candidatus Nitrotoga sp.]MDO9446758.1 alpha/beta fold hydrolase [Candidatus Nitrotoga sp.]MDP3496990.1 alpha/beta fold hydrolase [Candidatus Nitrotoga sp.]